MLIVIAIIAVLIASVMGGLKTARQMAWRIKARDTARQLVGAWNLYLTDNREFPVETSMSDARDEGGYAASMANIDRLNPYIDLSAEERDESEMGKNGLRDKWNRHFGFNLDFDYNGDVEDPAPVASGRKLEDNRVHATAIAWSQGATPENKKKWIVQW